MVTPDISGILFTADPINGNRNVVSIDASFGLGEALVSGMVSADLFKVKNGSIIHKKVSQKKLAIYSLPDGGTVTRDLPASQQEKQSLTDQQIIELATLGKKIEQHYGTPQDIEFCMRNGAFFIVQSRPITTLYPLPDLPQKPLRVFLSAGHIQMMTDAMKPLGIPVLLTIIPAKIPVQVGGRLFIDPTDLLHLKLGYRLLPRILTMAGEAMSRAVSDIINRPEFLVGRKSSNAVNRSTIMKTANDKDFYDGLVVVNGGNKFKQAFEDFLEQYGMRCPGEIDMTNPRWRESPTQLLSALFSHMRSVRSGEHRSCFAEGEKEAEKAAQRILHQVKGNKRIARLISVFRYMGGLREHPKYF